MKASVLTRMLFVVSLIASDAGYAQNQAAPTNPLDMIPDKIPFDTPYGAPISLSRAQILVQAAVTEANKRGWTMNVAVTDSGANLVAFVRMDGAVLAASAISQHKARAAVTFRRPTKFYEDALQKPNLNYLLTLDGVVASRGGIPLIENNKVIGGIGCSGGTSSQDEAICAAAASTINK
jgi:glc operon protein GlcG